MGWCLVTGGAKSLGAELCRHLAKSGRDVVVHYNTRADEAETIAKECRGFGAKAQTIQADFSSQKEMDRFITQYLDRFSETDVLINNVGNFFIGTALQTSLQDWDALIQTNLNAPFALTKALTPSLIKQHGSVINIGVAGMDSGIAETYATAYFLTKTALRMLTKSLAKELASVHVQVNMVSPGLLETAVDLAQILPQVPLKRAGLLAEVARVIDFLLCEENRYITGQNIEVAGGLWL